MHEINSKKSKEKKSKSYIPACFSSAKMASLAFKPYFSRRFSPLTCISSKGFPMQKREYAGLDMIEWTIVTNRVGIWITTFFNLLV